MFFIIINLEDICAFCGSLNKLNLEGINRRRKAALGAGV